MSTKFVANKAWQEEQEGQNQSSATLSFIQRNLQSMHMGLLIAKSGECFTKTKIDLKFDLAMAGHSCHCLLSPIIGIGLSKGHTDRVHKSTEFTFLDDSLLKKKYLNKL